MFGILCSLGTWQVFRLYEKRALVASIDAGLSRPPHLLETLTHLTPFERVQVHGHFPLSPPLWIRSKPYGRQVGQYGVFPFQTLTGEWILVLRGWTDTQPIADDDQPIALVGQIRKVTPPRWFETQGSSSGWVRIDNEAMGRTLGLSLPPFYILEDTPPAPFKALPQRPTIPNNHLAYILTWFSLAFALCIMVFIFLRKDARCGGSNHNPG